MLTVRQAAMSYSPNPDRQERSWQEVACLLERDYEQADLEAVQVIFAAIAAHRIVEYPPVWMMAVAPSGSLKTATIESLRGLPSAWFVDEVTPQTFISGKMDDKKRPKRQTPASLLHRIGSEGIMLAADFSTIISMDERNRAKILAQLRRIYDGRFCREFGTDENLDEREWSGRLTFVTGVTPDVDAHYSIFRSLGERFIQVRWGRAGGVETGLKAIQQSNKVPEELRIAVHRFLSPIRSKSGVPAPEIALEMQVRLSTLSEFVALCRALVPRARNTHEIVAEPSPEGNTRLPQQFAQLARGACVLAGRSEVTEQDFVLVKRAAFDSIPGFRRTAIAALTAGRSPYSTGAPAAVASRTLEDLEALKIAEKIDERNYRLSKIALRLIEGF